MSLTVPVEEIQTQPYLADPLDSVLSGSVWQDRLEPVLALVRQTRTEPTDARFTTDAIANALRAGKFTRLWMSSHFGGENASLAEGIAVVAALAGVDASVGWQTGVQGAIGRISDYLPTESAIDLFATNDDFVIGSVNPTGKYISTTTGFTVSGRWSFASGERHAKWFVCAAIPDAASPVKEGIRMFFVPRESLEVHDVWRTLGLRRTGSNDYTLDAVEVPATMSVRQEEMFAAPPERAERGYPISYYDFGPFTSSGTMLGLARAALSEFKFSAAGRVRAASSAPISLSHTTQDAVGRAEIAYVQAAAVILHAAHTVSSPQNLTADEVSALVRLSAASVAETCTSIVATMFRLAGTAAIYETSPLEQYFRDAHVAAKHITLSPTNFEMAGQYLLGGPLQMRR